MGRLREIIFGSDGQAGYSLIGTALLIVVIGMFSVAGVAIYNQYSWTEKSEVTNANLEIVKEALAQYKALNNGRLPCPARLDSAPTTPEFGVETNCSSAPVGATFQTAGRGGRMIRFGAVPVRTLNISEASGFDGWRHRIVYAVTEVYTSATPPSDIEDMGAISIVDGAGNSATASDGNVIYTLLAPGSDTRGAYSMEGIEINACASGKNCEFTTDKIFANMLRQWGGDTEYTSKLNYSASAVAYEWRVPPWGPCSAEAGNIQKRGNPVCYVKNTNTVVPDEKCGALIKPITEQTCRDEYWYVYEPPCPDACGPPQTIAITVECRQKNETVIPDSQCLQSVGAKPPTSKVCTFQYNPCPTWQANPCGCVSGGYSSYGGGGSSSSSGGGSTEYQTYVEGAGWIITTTSTDATGATTYHHQGANAGHAAAQAQIQHQTSGGSSSSSSSSSSSGGTVSVLCTYFTRERKWLPKKFYLANLAYGMKTFGPIELDGYHFWAVPLVRFLRRHQGSWIEKVIFKVLVEGWVFETAYRQGVREKGDWRGKLVLGIMVPICFVIGLFAPKSDYMKLWQDITVTD